MPALTFYLIIQGEEKLKKLNFEQLVIFRPGLLRCNRIESRPIEKFTIILSNWLDIFEWWSVDTAYLAYVIVQEAIDCEKKPVGLGSLSIFEHSNIIRYMSKLHKLFLSNTTLGSVV